MFARREPSPPPFLIPFKQVNRLMVFFPRYNADFDGDEMNLRKIWCGAEPGNSR